jgi:8-amino-7-oxononanoate synthase
MINAAMPFIFSTAPPPFQAYMTQKAIELCSGDEGEMRRERLKTLCEIAQNRLGGAGTHIVPIILGDDDVALNASQALQDQGFDIRAIRPPTVAEGSARLRLSLSANLEIEELNNFLDCVKPYLL